MKFYRLREMDANTHPAVLWHRDGSGAIYEFQQGECEVADEDAAKIELLKGLGFWFRDEQTGELVTVGTQAEARARAALLGQQDTVELAPATAPNPDAPAMLGPIVRKPKARRAAQQ